MSEPMIDIGPPIGAVITVTVLALSASRSCNATPGELIWPAAPLTPLVEDNEYNANGYANDSMHGGLCSTVRERW